MSLSPAMAMPIPHAIRDFDLAKIERRLERQGVPDAGRRVEELRKVMALVALYPKTRIAPSKAVDAAWHELILDTKTYQALCRAAFGVDILHHAPDDSGSGLLPQYHVTLELYRRHFGEPDPALWGPDGANSMDHALEE